MENFKKENINQIISPTKSGQVKDPHPHVPTSSSRRLSTRCATVSAPLTPQTQTLAATPTAAEPLQPEIDILNPPIPDETILYILYNIPSGVIKHIKHIKHGVLEAMGHF